MADNRIELRSEKVRHIIGEMPSGIVRYGITLITIVILGLLVGIYFIPYPETISARIQMVDAHQGTMTIPYKYINTIQTGMNVSIMLEGYDTEIYGVTNGTIISLCRTPQPTTNGNIFTAKVSIKHCNYKTTRGMTGTASILIGNESVLHRIIQRIANII
jgi:hypothetical protein